MAGNWQFQDFEVRSNERRLLRGGENLALGARAFDLLPALIQHRDRVVTKGGLLSLVWPGLVVEENNLTVQVSALRRVLGPGAISTVPGRGYRFTVASDVVAAPLAWAGYDLATDRSDAPDTCTDLSLPAKPSIAVLPFDNFSADADQGYFCDGITEDIITDLSRLHSLFVIARNSSFSHKGRPTDVRTVARELGVRYVLEGSIRRSADRIRVTAQLIDAQGGQHIRAEKCNRVLDDVFAVQEELTCSTVLAIAPEIEAAERYKARRRPASLGAYETAVRAWATVLEGVEKGDPALRGHAIDEARRALAIDADSMLALGTIAFANQINLYHRTAPDRAAAMCDGMEAAERMLSLDHMDSRAHAMLGTLDAALASLRHAHDLNPNDILPVIWMGWLESCAGHAAVSVALFQQFLRNSPRDPWRWNVQGMLSFAHFLVKDYPAAARHAQIMIDHVPKVASGHLNLALALVGCDIEAARPHLLEARQCGPALVEGRLAGDMPYRVEEHRQRYLGFLRIAAGLEDHLAADAPHGWRL